MHQANDPFGIVGQVLDGQFRVDQLVGEGGFSAVYRGHHLGLAEPIAIKCLRLPPTLTPQLIEQFVSKFRDESRILYRLSQGNLHIVRSIASGSWTDPKIGIVVPYMVLEWLDGRSVANDFTVRRTTGYTGRPLDEVVRIFASAADGLGYAHSQGVIHRDLNPGNLFLAHTRQGPKMKVLDFGVAKLMHDSALNLGPRAQTIGAIRIFAPAYGSPEQFDDNIGPIGAQSDVHAFALILMEALRDRCVNEGQHLGEFAMRAVDPHNRPTPRSLGIDVSDDIENVFARATMLDPRERWASVSDFWKAVTASATSPVMVGALKSTVQGVGPAGTARLDKTMPLGSPHIGSPAFNAGAAGGAAAPAAGMIPAVRPAAGAPAIPLRTPLPPRPGGAPQTPVPPAPPARANVPRSATAGALAQPTSKPRIPTTMGLPPPPRRQSERNVPAATRPLTPPGVDTSPPPGRKPIPSDLPVLDHEEELPTKIGGATSSPVIAAALDAGWDTGEDEDEVTRVRAPDDEVLRELAEQQRALAAREAAPTAKGNKTLAYQPPQVPRAPESGGTLVQAAPVAKPPQNFGAPRPAAGAPPPMPEPPEPPEPVPPSLGGGTLMMAPGMQLPPLPQNPNAAPPPYQGQGDFPPVAPPFDPTQIPQSHAAPMPPMAPMPMQPMQQPPYPQPGHQTPNAAFAPMQPQQQGGPQQQSGPQQGGPLAMTMLHPGGPAYPPHPQQPMQPPNQQLRQPTPQQMQPQLPPQQQQQGQAPFMPSPYARPSGDSFSMPPRSVAVPQAQRQGGPKVILIVGILAGVFLLFGVGGLAVFLLRRPSTTTTTVPSGTPTIASSVPVVVTTPSVDPTPPPTAEVDAGAPTIDDAQDAGAAAPPPTTTPPNPTPFPTDNPQPQPPNTAAVVKDTKDAAPAAPVDPNAFNEGAARGKLTQANYGLSFCKKEGGITGPGSASVTFATDGSVINIAFDPPYAGTKEAECVAGQFKRQKVNAFQGSPQTIKHSFDVPK